MATTLDVDIEYLNVSGDGVARLGRRLLIVPYTIPGERVRVATPHRPATPSSVTNATLVEVLRASPHRVTPLCPHFGLPTGAPASRHRQNGDVPLSGTRRSDEQGCGGCSWQHIAYTEQLQLKRELVERLLHESLGRSPVVEPTRPGTAGDEPWGYRQKANFVFGNGRSSRPRPALVMGHYARGSRRIIPVRTCPVHDERGNRAAFLFLDSFARAGIAASDNSGRPLRRTPTGALRSLAIRVAASSDELMATLVVTNDRDSRLRTATRRAMEHVGSPTSLHLNIHSRGDAFIFGPDTRRLIGPERLRDTVAGTHFLISPTAFFQTNVHAAQLLVQIVLEAVPVGSRQVLDLYAGAGLFALPLARRGHVVTAIEESRSAVADGEASARLNQIAPAQCRFVAGRVESALSAIRGADVVVLDPPREGCDPVVIADVLGRLRPDRVIYISCNPEALARDLQPSASFGYAIDRVQPVDMFPHTAHVETVVTLRRTTATASPSRSDRRR